MSGVGLPAVAVLVPLLAAGAAWLAPSVPLAATLAIVGTTLGFGLTAALPWLPFAGAAMLADPLSIHMAVLTGFVAMTGAWFARAWWRGREPAAARRDMALAPAMLAALLLTLLADDLFLVWSGMAVAVVLLAAAAPVASRERLVLGGALALAAALLGTLLLGLAAAPATGPGAESWSLLVDAAPHAQGALLTLAGVFLLLGYGTLAGLVPLHGAMLAAAEGPEPLAGTFVGLLQGAALIVLLRTRAVLAANPEATAPGLPLVALGLLSLLLAALTLRGRRGSAGFLAVAGLGQAGVVAVAFGLGGGAAIFAGVLHLTLFILLRTALLFGLARLPDNPRGLLRQHPAFALTLAAGLVALAGVPPFGLFTSIFLIVMEATREAPLVALLLGVGLAACAWSLLGRAVALCRMPAEPVTVPPPAALIPAWLHLAVVLLLGLAMPPAVVEWLARIAVALR